MGYTHYWRGTDAVLRPETWQKIVDDFKKIYERNNGASVLALEYDEADKPPKIDYEEIRFNGKDDDGHETFLLTPELDDFTFCKTAYKPYDKFVTAALILAKHHARAAGVDWINVSSDGDTDDWGAGFRMVVDLLGDDVKMPFFEDNGDKD